MRWFTRGGRAEERKSTWRPISASVVRVLMVVIVVWFGIGWWVTNRPPTEEERQRRLVSRAVTVFSATWGHAYFGMVDAYYEIIDGGGSPEEAGLSVEHFLADAVLSTKARRARGLDPLDADAFYFNDDLERWARPAPADEPYILLLNKTPVVLRDGRTGYPAYLVRGVSGTTYDAGQAMLTEEELEAYGGGLRRLELP
ncbi:MAG: hypothetical protein JJU33_01180 [Phycisphaerales bacterium]|nr:hypothetical protein [Phycisphaerales bacterium]